MKVAILGVWHVHAPGYTKEAAALGEVIGVYDRDPAWCAGFAEKFNIPAFSSREELLSSEAEGVIICSATNLHTEDVIAAARAGKAIFIEKVLALTTEECREIKSVLDETGVPFVISYPQRYSARTLTALSVIQSGELGRINYIRFRNCHNGSTGDWLPPHFYDKEACGGGAMIDLGAHGMYLIDAIHGLPDTYGSGFGRFCDKPSVLAKNADGVEDNAVTVMSYADGCVAVNETGFVSVASPSTLEIGGETGYMTVVGDTVVKASAATGYKPQAVELLPAAPSPLAQFMTQSILPGCGIEEAIHLTRMMEGAYGR